MAWNGTSNIGSRSYRCGYCGNIVASAMGYFKQNSSFRVHICPHCECPSFFDQQSQVPGIAPGNDVGNLPDHIASLYREARYCVSVFAYTASVLACRKLLMNIAVAQGAPEGNRFIEYVEYLADNGYVPPNGKGWVDHIRKKGNEATHEIVIMSQADSEELISFIEMLLKFIYEFPSKIPSSP